MSVLWGTQGCLTSCAWCGRGWGGAGPGAGAAAEGSGLPWPSNGSMCLWSCPGHGGYGPFLPESSEYWTEMCILLKCVHRERGGWETNSKRMKSRRLKVCMGHHTESELFPHATRGWGSAPIWSRQICKMPTWEPVSRVCHQESQERHCEPWPMMVPLATLSLTGLTPTHTIPLMLITTLWDGNWHSFSDEETKGWQTH